MPTTDRSAPLSGWRLTFLPVACLAVGLLSYVGPLSAAEDQAPVGPKQPWTSLFDGKSLGKWEVVKKYDFKRHGKIHIEEAAVVLETGAPATGIRWTGDFPKSGYEFSLEGRRTAGSDFFCGITFPVQDAALTLVCGGWGGTVFGMSSIDGEPAVENETANYQEFELGRWYRIRVRVTEPLVEAWIDDEKIIELPTADRKFSLYWEMEPMQPLGICSWVTTGALRKIRFRRVQEKPPAGAPLENAVAVWHMVDDRDAGGKNRVLIPKGNVKFGEQLAGIDHAGSLRRGGDGMAARCRGGRILAGGSTEPILSGDSFTVAIRLRDSLGRWNSGLLSNRTKDGRTVLHLFAADPGSGMELGLDLRTGTDAKPVRLTTPVAEIGPTGWHDLIARYDGAKVELFVDGRVVAEAPAKGMLMPGDSRPWLIGAVSDDVSSDGGFHGLIDHAAVWDRALSDDEIELISGGKDEILQKKRLAEERRAKAKAKEAAP